MYTVLFSLVQDVTKHTSLDKDIRKSARKQNHEVGHIIFIAVDMEFFEPY